MRRAVHLAVRRKRCPAACRRNPTKDAASRRPPARIAARRDALRAAEQCDLLFSIGTSALVYPAAELPQRALAAGATGVQVNPTVTPLDRQAHCSLHGAAADVMPRLLAAAFGATGR
ncbi:hypothetical protein G6F57_018325 [Rhizopus arrhizus]|nr:hypothetical protein G6F57_018325 [Rhizopus arrhizus]